MKYVILSENPNSRYDEILGFVESEESAKILVNEWDGCYYKEVDVDHPLNSTRMNLEHLVKIIKGDNNEKTFIQTNGI